MQPFRWLQYALLCIVVIVADFPLLWMLLTSLKPDAEIVAYPPTMLPATPSLQNFVTLFDVVPFGTYLWNTFMVAGITTVAVVVLASGAAYAMARFNFAFLRVIGGLALFSYMIPSILLLVPLTQIALNLGLANNKMFLIILYTSFHLPFGLWIMRSYFKGVGVELEEAAMCDGCTRFGALIRVVTPQVVPGMISTAVIAFNSSWGEFLYAATLLTRPGERTLSPGIALLLSQTGLFSWGILMAASVMMTMTVVVLFVVAQRQLVATWGEGAVKG